MKTIRHIAVLLLMLLPACSRQQDLPPPTPGAASQVTTEADAITVVLAYIEEQGGDAQRDECSAQLMGEEWWVTAPLIATFDEVEPAEPASGEFATYIVSTEGEVMRTVSNP